MHEPAHQGSVTDTRAAVASPATCAPPWTVRVEREATIAVVVLVAIALAFWLPCAVHPTWWGYDNWDRITSLAAVARATILEHRQFPFWNPYMSGGLPLLANPQTAFLSVSFIPVLLGGEVVGFRLRVLYALCVGLIAGYLLGRRLTTGRWAPYVVAAVFFLSSWYPLYMATGHEDFLALAYLPLVVLFYDRACDDWRWAPLAGACLALMIIEGGMYPVPYTVLMLGALAAMASLNRRQVRPLVALAVTLCFGVAIAGVKSLPTLSYLLAHPRVWGFVEAVIPLHALDNIFLSRRQLEGAYFPGSFYYWHEYGCYVGWVPLALAVVGFVHAPRRALPWLVIAILFVALMLGDYGAAAPWHWLHKAPVFSSMHDTPRFRVITAFAIAIMAGIGLEGVSALLARLRLPRAAQHTVVGLLVAFVVVDLLLVNGPIYGRMSSSPPQPHDPPGAFQQIRIAENAHLQAYPSFLRGMGLVNNYEPMQMTGAGVRAASDPEYRGEVWIEHGTVSTRAWSPNRLEYDVHVREADRLVVNQRFVRGWYAGDGRQVEAWNGLISVALSPQDERIVLRYRPPFFLLGSAISTLALGLTWVAWRRARRASADVPLRSSGT